MPLTRDDALAAVRSRIDDENLVRHMIATEAIMRALARRFDADEAEWGLAGLLHDIDLGAVGDDMTAHSKVSADIARALGASDAVCQAILTHNEAHGIARETLLDKALFCADPLTGLITAAALVRSRKLANISESGLRRNYREQRFATGANREQIALCSELGLALDDFLAIGLEAMRSVAEELGL